MVYIIAKFRQGEAEWGKFHTAIMKLTEQAIIRPLEYVIIASVAKKKNSNL